MAYGTSGWKGLNCCWDGGGDADSRAGLRPKAGVAWGVEAGVWPGVTAPKYRGHTRHCGIELNAAKFATWGERFSSRWLRQGRWSFGDGQTVNYYRLRHKPARVKSEFAWPVLRF